MDTLLEILDEIRPDLDFTVEDALMTDGILDSFDVISLVSEINARFNIDINVNDLLPENFDSAENIYALITKLQGK